MGGDPLDVGGVRDVARDAADPGEAGRGRLGDTPGITTGERARTKELERENRELRRADEILNSAAAFFGAKVDRRQKR